MSCKFKCQTPGFPHHCVLLSLESSINWDGESFDAIIVNWVFKEWTQQRSLWFCKNFQIHQKYPWFRYQKRNLESRFRYYTNSLHPETFINEPSNTVIDRGSTRRTRLLVLYHIMQKFQKKSMSYQFQAIKKSCSSILYKVCFKTSLSLKLWADIKSPKNERSRSLTRDNIRNHIHLYIKERVKGSSDAR